MRPRVAQLAHTSHLLVSQHWQQFEPPLTLWDIFGANREVKELLEQDLLLLDHRCVGTVGRGDSGVPRIPDYRSRDQGEVRNNGEVGAVGAGALAQVGALKLVRRSHHIQASCFFPGVSGVPGRVWLCWILYC